MILPTTLTSSTSTPVRPPLATSIRSGTSNVGVYTRTRTFTDENEYEHAHLINDMRTEMHLTRCTVCRYTKDRSATIREAVDILQEASV
jgi:hypothetical protein